MLIKLAAKHVELAVALMQKVADGKTSAVTFWNLTEPRARGQAIWKIANDAFIAVNYRKNVRDRDIAPARRHTI